MEPAQVAPRQIPAVLRGRRVVVGVSGGVAAFKSAGLVSTLVQGGAEVRVVMTPDAERFIGPLTLAAISQQPVLRDLWAGSEQGIEAHVELAEWAEAMVVYPATARTLGRLALGLPEEALSAVALATEALVVVAPAMYDRMYDHPATRQNLNLLVKHGAIVVPPGEGRLASGKLARGRLAPEQDVLEALASALSPKPMAGDRVIVTAGGTREPIDPVRFISNRSSGRMGHALARVAARLGAEVVLITAAEALESPPGVRTVRVETAAQMLAAIEQEWAAADLLLMSAAVSDHRPAQPAQSKLPKSDQGDSLALVRNPDLLAALTSRRRDEVPFVVGFAAETDGVLDKARAKLRAKGTDLIVANDVSSADSGMGSEFNAVSILAPDGRTWTVTRAPKEEVAAAILAAVLEVRSEVRPPGARADRPGPSRTSRRRA